MVVSGTEKKYKAYLEKQNSRWNFGNSILYDMCREHHLHNDADVVVGKIWLIGRSYAAAIERRKNAKDDGDDFYYDTVAPKLLEIGAELDEKIDLLRKSRASIADNSKQILETHKFLMDAFHEITGLKKRSLASKYLHFHCPDKFFIYDSRARTAIRAHVNRPDKKLLDGINCDPEYGDFVCRMLELQEYLNEKNGVLETPRRLDSFLLSE